MKTYLVSILENGQLLEATYVADSYLSAIEMAELDHSETAVMKYIQIVA